METASFCAIKIPLKIWGSRIASQNGTFAYCCSSC